MAIALVSDHGCLAMSDAHLGKHTGFGQKYVVEDPIEGAGGRSVSNVVVWVVLVAEDFPGFVTAYPGVNR